MLLVWVFFLDRQGFFRAFFTTIIWCQKFNLQLSFQTQSSIFYHFNNPYIFHCNCRALFLIHYQLEKHFKEGYIFSVFYHRGALSSNPAYFKLQNFHNLSWATMGGGEGETKIHSNHKTQSAKQK